MSLGNGRLYESGATYGIITDNADPDGLGRVKVALYSLGKDITTDWIPIITPALEMFWLPEIEDQVAVAFMGDNPDLPFVLGPIWSISQMPPLTGENSVSERNKDGKNNLRFMRSRSGNRLIFDDSKDNEKIQMISSGDTSRIELSSKGTNLLLKTTGEFGMLAKGKVRINGQEVRIKSKKGIVHKSKDIKVEGKDVNIKGGNAIGVKGNGINLN